MTTDYHIDVFYSPEDECWIADVPDLQHCSAHAPTPEDAVREVMGRAAQPTSTQSDTRKLEPLQQQVTQLTPGVRTYKLERDPQLGDLVMGLVTQIETITAQQCGTPTGSDLALLLLAHQAEEQ